MEPPDERQTPTATSPTEPDAWVDDLGRKAGEALRRPAPPGGLTDLERRHARQQRRRITATIGVGAVLIAAVALVVRLRSEHTSAPFGPTPPVKVTEHIDATSFGDAVNANGGTNAGLIDLGSLCVGSRCASGTGVSSNLVKHWADGMTLDPDEWIDFFVGDPHASPYAVYWTELNAVDVPGCGQGLLLNVGWGPGHTVEGRMVVTGRSDALGAVTGSLTGTDTGSWLDYELSCRGGQGTALPTTTAAGTTAIDFTTADDPDAFEQWDHAPICRPHAPRECMRLTRTWDKVTGTMTGRDLRVTSAVEQDGRTSSGAASLVMFDGDVTGCGTGTVLLSEWSTGRKAGEWTVIPETGEEGLKGMTARGTVRVSGSTHHFTGAVTCSPSG